MDNFELHEKAQALADTQTGYHLARRCLQAEAERDSTVEQAVYWRERAVGAEGERDALAAENQRLETALAHLRGSAPAMRHYFLSKAKACRAGAKNIQDLLPYADGPAYYQDKDRLARLTREADLYRKWAADFNDFLKEETE